MCWIDTISNIEQSSRDMSDGGHMTLTQTWRRYDANSRSIRTNNTVTRSEDKRTPVIEAGRIDLTI